jgi:multidrug efflux pump subunit AcrA (membrane-fusion protein)
MTAFGTWMKRRWIWIAAAAVVLVGVAWFVTHKGRPTASADPGGSAVAAPSVQLATARQGTFVVRVTAQGRIGPPAGSSAKLAFPEPGIVGAIDVHVGEAVSAGQPLVELNRAGLATAVSQARADAHAAAAGYSGGAVPSAALRTARARLVVATARLNTLRSGGEAALSTRISAQSAARQAALKVETDRANFARAQALFRGGVLATKDVEAARAQLATDEADQRAAEARVAAAGADFHAAVQQAQADVALAQSDVAAATAQAGTLGAQADSAAARLAAAELAYENGVLRAPQDGVVLAILKHPGEAVDTTTPVLEVGPLLGHDITLNVPANEARRIVVGDPATVQDLQTRGTTHGRVIAVVPAVDPTTQVSIVVVRGVPADAVSGHAVTATIVVAHESGVLIPSSAIVEDPQTGKTVVFVQQAATPTSSAPFRSQEVNVRTSDAQTAVIASGLHAGDRVAAQGGYALLAPSGG